MSLKQSLHNEIDNYVERFLQRVSKKFSLSYDQLSAMWEREQWEQEKGNETSRSIKKDPVDNLVSQLVKKYDDDISKSVHTLTKAELAALCKDRGLKCSGNKAELIARLTDQPEPPKEKKEKKERKTKKVEGKESGNETEEDESEEIVKPKKSGKSMKEKSENKVASIAKIDAKANFVSLRKNEFRRVVHAGTGLVYDEGKGKMIGVQKDDGTVRPLTEDDIELCKRYKFKFELPLNLDTDDVEDAKVDELDEDEQVLEEVEKEENKEEVEELEEAEEDEDVEESDEDVE